MLVGILILLGLTSSALAIEKTMKTVTLPLGYVPSASANTDYIVTKSLKAPDGVSQIYSLIVRVKGDYPATTTISARVRKTGDLAVYNCNPINWTSPSSVSNNYETIFDCSSLANNYDVNSGNIDIGFKTNKASTNVFASMEVTYYNNPAGSMTIHGTEYTYGQMGRVWLQLLDTNNSAITTAVCYTDIYTPDGGILLERATMTNMVHDGIYYYNLDIPVQQGVYPAIATCYYQAGQTFNYGTTINMFNNATLDGGSLNDTHVNDGVYMLTTESPTPLNPRRYGSYINFTTGNICSNISEALFTGISLYWVGRWNSNIGNDVITISLWNYTSNAWVDLPNTITGVGTGSKSVTNSLSFNNITKVGFVNSSGTNLRLRFLDTSLADTSSTALDYDYLALSCDQLSNPQFQEVKGSSELHVSSDLLYRLESQSYVINNSQVTTLYNGSNVSEIYYTGIFKNAFSISSGVTSNQSNILVEYQGLHSIPCNSIISFFTINSTGYYPYPFTTQRQTTEDHCSINFYINLTVGGTTQFEAHARNVWESDLRSTNTGVNAIYPLVNAGCLLWQIIHNYPAYIVPKNQTNVQYDYYYRACGNFYDDFYWFNQTYQTSLNYKANITNLEGYLQYESDYSSAKFAEDKLNTVTFLLLQNLLAVGQYSKLIVDNPLGNLTNLTDQKYWGTHSTIYENWLLLNASCGTGKCRINGTDVWEYYNRTLTSIDLSNANITVTATVNNTAVANAVWNYNGTIGSTLSNNLGNAVWSYTGSIVLINNQIAQQVWNYTSRYTHGEILS